MGDERGGSGAGHHPIHEHRYLKKLVSRFRSKGSKERSKLEKKKKKPWRKKFPALPSDVQQKRAVGISTGHPCAVARE
jgi:hypothetical protein